jgi:hypothetical protein
MVDLLKYKRTANLVVMLSLLGLGLFLRAQVSTVTSDADQIAGLMANLSEHSKTPTAVLDPTLNPSDCQKNLGHFSASQYELSIVPTEGIPTAIGDSVSVPVRVHYRSEDGNSLDTSATAQFIRRNGIWYFSNFDFMKWPAILIIVLMVGILVGVSYAATVLILGSRLLKQGPLGINRVKMFVPLFWPALFRQTK